MFAMHLNLFGLTGVQASEKPMKFMYMPDLSDWNLADGPVVAVDEKYVGAPPDTSSPEPWYRQSQTDGVRSRGALQLACPQASVGTPTLSSCVSLPAQSLERLQNPTKPLGIIISYVGVFTR